MNPTLGAVASASIAARGETVIDTLLESDRLEILYNWPGCVTPNEFFHRIFVALARKRNGKRPGAAGTASPHQESSEACEDSEGRSTAEIVVLNGLDHLDVKFPLCASERLFVPGLVSLFRCFKVCSIVISAEDRLGSANDIRPLSDLILEFTEADGAAARVIPAGSIQTSKLTAVRVPAGQLGGLWGVLSRDGQGRMDFSLP